MEREFESRFPLNTFSLIIKIIRLFLRLTDDGPGASSFVQGVLPESTRSHARAVQFSAHPERAASQHRVTRIAVDSFPTAPPYAPSN